MRGYLPFAVCEADERSRLKELPGERRQGCFAPRNFFKKKQNLLDIAKKWCYHVFVSGMETGMSHASACAKRRLGGASLRIVASRGKRISRAHALI